MSENNSIIIVQDLSRLECNANYSLLVCIKDLFRNPENSETYFFNKEIKQMFSIPILNCSRKNLDKFIWHLNIIIDDLFRRFKDAKYDNQKFLRFELEKEFILNGSKSTLINILCVSETNSMYSSSIESYKFLGNILRENDEIFKSDDKYIYDHTFIMLDEYFECSDNLPIISLINDHVKGKNIKEIIDELTFRLKKERISDCSFYVNGKKEILAMDDDPFDIFHNPNPFGY